MMEGFGGTSGPQKFRHNFGSTLYHNNAQFPRNMRQIGNDYAMPNCNRRTPSVHGLWQERMSPRSCVIERKPSRGKLCSVALAIASFVVLVVVLAIAGLALYMGALHSEPITSSSLISFSCSAKVTRGDRFVGALLQEKARRYRMQLENLYQRSVLGPGLVSCTVEKFGDDTVTVFFKLVFNQKKLNRSVANTEKTIRDILITDAISRKPIFRTVRFDPKSIEIKPNNIEIDQRPISSNNNNKPKSTSNNSKSGILKSPFRQNTTLPVRKKTQITEEIDIPEEDLPVIQGSFKISKTEADITEKKTETSTPKAKVTTTSPGKKTTTKESSVTSALYKIAAIEKITTEATTRIISIATSTTGTTTNTPTGTTTKTTTKHSETSPLFVVNPHLFDEEPWIPIMPGIQETTILTTSTKPSTKPSPSSSSVLPPEVIEEETDNKQPVYTSFTNPGLSYHAFDTVPLGSTSLKSHPIPVNKILDSTEPSIFSSSTPSTTTTIITTEYPSLSLSPTVKNDEESSFVEVETVKYVPGSLASSTNETSKLKQDQLLRNLSSIFHNLASNLKVPPDLNLTNPPYLPSVDNGDPREDVMISEEDLSLGQGQVEVVEADEASLMMQTTKLPLVTLIPVKSNSGIGRPLRKRPYKFNEDNSTNLSVENRSFPGTTRFNDLIDKKFIETEVVTSISSEVNKVKKNKLDEDFRIVGILNFATESSELRNPKMEPPVMNSSEIAIISMNSSVSSNRKEPIGTFNLLTPEKLKQLSEISKIHDNSTVIEDAPIISNKAISANSYTINHSGFKIVTKTFNKINDLPKESNKINNFNNGIAFTTFSNKTAECANFTIKCGDGQCLPESTKCNQLIDCNDGKDEQNCNCADYLRSQYLLRKICDGVVDCWDYSDENQCEWCKPNQYVCGNSKVCIDRNKICDGLRDCPQGDDERQCVTISTDLKSAEEFPYYPEGYLMVRKFGNWGKLCVENFQSVVTRSKISWEISDLGKAVCKSMTYQTLNTISSVVESDLDSSTKYFELSYSSQNKSKQSLSFSAAKCESRKIVKVKCQSLECGARPQAVKHIARVVGGGNAGLGSWPWQAALYKEGEFQCGATLLSNRWLVSAGHCFYHSQEEHWVARLGALRRGTALPSPYEQLRLIVRIIVHPGYVDSGFINDISLLKMEFPVIFSDYVRPICLPTPAQTILDGTLCTVVGWGQLFEVGRIFPDTLQEVQVPVISTSECRKRTVFLPLYKITDDMFCAGYERGGRDACLGDSGGPLMCPEPNGRWILQGITSNGYGCARANRPGVYTKVENYVPWITKFLSDDEETANKSSKSVCLGHRCPLGECLPKSRLCNGYIECSDGSDERDC